MVLASLNFDSLRGSEDAALHKFSVCKDKRSATSWEAQVREAKL